MSWNGFRGVAKRLDDIDLPKLGKRLGVGEDELHAFIDVETRGSGFDYSGRLIMLPERHRFYQNLRGAELQLAIKRGLAYKTWGSKPYPRTADECYALLNRMMEINETAALKSCSWGLGQVMGENHIAAGYDTVQEMVRAFMNDEEAHLEAAVNFILYHKLDDELRRHDWAGFAKGYNGPAYKKNRYDEKLATAFTKWKRIKDTPYSEAAAEPPAVNKPAEQSSPMPPAQVEKKLSVRWIILPAVAAVLVFLIAKGLFQ